MPAPRCLRVVVPRETNAWTRLACIIGFEASKMPCFLLARLLVEWSLVRWCKKGQGSHVFFFPRCCPLVSTRYPRGSIYVVCPLVPVVVWRDRGVP